MAVGATTNREAEEANCTEAWRELRRNSHDRRTKPQSPIKHVRVIGVDLANFNDT